MYASVTELLELARRCEGGQLEFHPSEHLTHTGKIEKVGLENNGVMIKLAYRARLSNGEWKLDKQQATYNFSTENCAILNIEEGVHQLVWRDTGLVLILKEPRVGKISVYNPFTMAYQS